MKLIKLIVILFIFVSIAIILSSDYGIIFLNYSIDFLGRKGVAGVVTTVIGLIGSFLMFKFKKGYSSFENNINFKIDRISENQKITDDKIDKLKSEWESIKKVKATRAGYQKQLTAISTTSMNYFKIDFNLKKFATVISEAIIDFSSDIHKYNKICDINYENISSKLTVISEMIRQTGDGVLENAFIDLYMERNFYPELKNFKHKIKYIINDKDNDKSSRFHKECQNFLKVILSELLTEYLDAYKSS